MGTEPWNNWYHVTIHTYGSWLRGDPRGWRSRHHKDHVNGDYKNLPEKGKYDALLELSKSVMTRDPVRIAKPLRTFVLERFKALSEADARPIAEAMNELVDRR